MTAFKNIIVPYDFSAHSEAALKLAAELAEPLGSKIHILFSVHVPLNKFIVGTPGTVYSAPASDTSQLIKAAERQLKEVAENANIPNGWEVHVSQGEDVAETMRHDLNKLKPDLIVMGTHGRTGLAHVFLGSVAERTLRHAPCPVLTTKAQEK